MTGDRAMTFAELQEQSTSWAAWLNAAGGIRKGDRVAVMLGNVSAYPVVLLGCLKAGAVQVSVNPHYTARELQHQLQDSDAQLLVVDTRALPIAAVAIEDTSVERVVVVGGGDAVSVVANVVACSFEEALAQGQLLEDWVPHKLTRDDLALLQYTGGTTGVSKGAQLSHGNLVANVLQARAMIDGVVERGREVVLTALPLYHIFALTVNLLTFATLGARNVLVANPRDASTLTGLIIGEKVTVLPGVNTLFASLLALPELRDEHFRRIKLAIGGGAAVQRAISEQWSVRSGRHILEGYGLSETSPVVTLNSCATDRFTGTVGLPVPSTDVKVADASGRSLPVGEQGEVCVKGPQVMRGYWRQPQANEHAFTADGYFRTGDIGAFDDQGQLRICDRKKDMVLVSGFNVYPNEIEGVLAAHPGVAECAVIGIPDDRTGEAVRAFVVRRDQALTESDLLSHCRDQLAAYKVPKRVEFLEALPKSAVGKVLRRELRDTREAEQGREKGFSGRVAIVTGAGAGLGRAHAKFLAAEGAKVVLVDLGERAAAVAKEIEKQGGEAVAYQASVTDDETIQSIVMQTLQRWGRIDVLVNNAGALCDKSFSSMSLDDFRRVVDVHLMGAVICSKAVWQAMRLQTYGRIVMVGSASGLYGNFGQSNYGAAKMAVVGLMQTLALEGAKYDIRVNCLVPTAATGMTDALLTQQAKEALAPEAVSPALLALAGVDAPTRAILVCGAGHYARAYITLTDGHYVGVAPGSAEDVRRHWDEISSRTTSSAPDSAASQVDRMLTSVFQARPSS